MNESTEQILLFKWASVYPVQLGKLGQFMFAIPNEGSRSKQHGARMKAQGLRSGVPDLMVAIPSGDYSGLFIELKRRQGGKTTDNQRKWLERLQRAGYKAQVCHGFDEAKQAIVDYLS